MKAPVGKRADTIIFCLIVLIGIIFSLVFFNYTTDDAFISFRYARNLARGYGLVFNPGERVEGFTNFLWTMLMVPGFLLDIDILIWHKILGILLSVLNLFFLWRLSLLVLFRMGKKVDSFWALIPPFLVSLMPACAIYSVNGMENPLFMLLLTLSAYFIIKGEGFFFVAGLLLGLLSLTRPEGVIFAGIALFVGLVHKMGSRFFFRILLGFILVFFPFMIFRATYYSELFPNTFYAKLNVYPLLRMKTWGARYITDLVRVLPYGIFIWLTLLCVPLIFNRRSPLLFLFLSFWGFIFYALYIGGDPFPYFRIFSLVVPVGAVLSMAGIMYLVGYEKSGYSGLRFLVVLIVGIWSLLSIKEGAKNFKELNSYFQYKPLRTRPLAAHWETWARIGERLKEILPKDSRLVVQDIGAIPFYSDLYTIDPIGLIDSTLAHMFFREGYNDYYQGYLPFETCAKVHKFVRDYVFDIQKADAILYHLDSRECDDFSISFHYHYLYLDPRFNNYEKVEEFKDPQGKCVYALFRRKGLPNQEPTVPQGRIPKRSKSYILY